MTPLIMDEDFSRYFYVRISSYSFIVYRVIKNYYVLFVFNLKLKNLK